MKLLDIVSFVKRGKNRRKVIEAMDKKPIMPSELVVRIFGKPSNTHFNLISRALGELKKEGLVKVLNEKEKTGRFYELTAEGKRIKKYL